VKVRKIKLPWANLGNAVVRPPPNGFDTRKTHKDQSKYTTLNKSVKENWISQKYLTSILVPTFQSFSPISALGIPGMTNAAADHCAAPLHSRPASPNAGTKHLACSVSRLGQYGSASVNRRVSDVHRHGEERVVAVEPGEIDYPLFSQSVNCLRIFSSGTVSHPSPHTQPSERPVKRLLEATASITAWDTPALSTVG
jgi:hypothetical protein